ncbi:MAG: trypsin-like serine protease [Planctomycetota bacterium]
MTTKIPTFVVHWTKLARHGLAMATLAASFFCVSHCSADETSVREYLAQNESTTYLQNGIYHIERMEAGRDVPVGSITFQKFANGLKIHGARVVVFEAENGKVNSVYEDSFENIKLNQNIPALDSVAAEERVQESVVNSVDSEAELVWFRLGNELILAWEVATDVADSGQAASPTGMETVIDATTGEVLSQRQLDTKTYQPGSPEVISGGAFPRIVINNAIGAAGSRAYAAPFDSIVEVNFGCTGVLIADNVVLSARHCGLGAGDTVIFGDNANSGTVSRTVQSASLPDGGGSLLDGGDVTILTLTSTVPSNVAEPMRLIDETDGLEGMLCATLGYGFNGLGSNGHGFSSDGFRWGGENIIDVYGSPAANSGSNIISTDFDDGSGGANTIGGSSSTPLEFEATTAPGDSGGPVLVQVGSEWVVAGVLSGGTTNTSVYGDISWWTGTALFRSQIENAGGTFVGNTEILTPNGLPEFIASGGGDTLEIEVVPSETDNIVPGSGIFHVNTGSGFEQFSLSSDSATTFTATFPASDCLSTVDYYISFGLESGGTVTLPGNAPSQTFGVLSAFDVANIFTDSFDTNTGWTVSGDATDGQWERGIPNNGDRGDPANDAETTGSGFCFVTDNGNTGGNDNSDVDGGSTILTSPVLDATGGSIDEVAFISYYRWYSNDFGGSPNADTFVVEISNNGGATWTNLETVGPAGAGTGGGWILVEYQIDEFVVPTDNMQLRFTASDLGGGSVVEAGVDGVTIKLVSCEDDVLHGDVNLDGVVNLLDVEPFVDLISSGGFQAEADVNKDGQVNLLDVGPFIDLLNG